MIGKLLQSLHDKNGVIVNMGFDFSVGNPGESIMIETNCNSDNVRLSISTSVKEPIRVFIPKNKFIRSFEGCQLVIKEIEKRDGVNNENER